MDEIRPPELTPLEDYTRMVETARKYTFTELVDIGQIQKLLESHFRMTGIISAILDAEENILVAVGWQDICTRFHRVDPRSCANCNESDAIIKRHLADFREDFLEYKCKNGLWDVAMPIIVDGEHLATFFTGQFFYEGETPDPGFFRAQAEAFGFDVNEYLEAVNRVPVFTPDFIHSALKYYRSLVDILTDMGLKNLKLAREVEERRRAETTLQHAKEYTENLIQGANVIIVGRDMDGNVNLFNRTAEEVSGYSFAEVAGSRWIDTNDDTDLHSERVKERDGRDTCETRIINRSGEGRSISWRNNPVIENGELVGTVSFGIDITEHRMLEDQHRQALKMESVGRLAGGVAHDFNNMLSVIMGHAELAMLKVPNDDPLRKHLDGILKAALRSRDVTRQLLAFSRKELVSPKSVNLNVSVIETQQTLGRLIGEDIRLSFRPATDLWAVRIDPSQVDQILVNLSVNARDAMPRGGDLDIETANVHMNGAFCRHFVDAAPGDYVRISVRDNGIGMAKEIMEHIFEPFFTTKEIGNGTGLGLATVYGIVTQNAGFIKVSSEPGKGTIFDIYFPRFMEEPEPETVPVHALHVVTETILLVEDDIMVREMVTEMLEQTGYTVINADTPEAALSICEEGSRAIDLILTDVVMPGMSGREMIEAVSAKHPGVRVLFMSGYTAELVEQRGVVEETMQFIQKPFDSAALSEKIQQSLASKAGTDLFSPRQ